MANSSDLRTARADKFVALKNKRNLRAWCRNATSSDIAEVIAHLEVLRKEKLEYEAEEASRIAQRREISLIYAKRQSLSNIHFPYDPQDILEAIVNKIAANPRRMRISRIKYRYQALDGIIYEWSGQGRLPRTFRDILSATGKSREDFMVSLPQDNSKAILGQRLENSIEENRQAIEAKERSQAQEQLNETTSDTQARSNEELNNLEDAHQPLEDESLARQRRHNDLSFTSLWQIGND